LRHGGSALIDQRILNKPFLKSKLGDYIEAIIDQQLFFQREHEVKQVNQKFSQTGLKIYVRQHHLLMLFQ
jgi:hypothetical protein